MPKTRFKKKVKSGNTYYFYRLRHKNLLKPRDLYGNTVKELQEKIDKLVYELDRGVQSDKSPFGDYMELWLEAVHLIDKKKSTCEKYRGAFSNYIKLSPIASVRLCDLTPLHVQEYYLRLVDGGVSAPLLRVIHGLISQCIRYAYTQNKVLMDFSRSLILPKTTKKKMDHTRRASRTLTYEEEKSLLKACKGTTFEPFIVTALNTGLRRGELLALTWDDVDFEKGLITVNKSYRPQTGTSSPKTETSNRQVPIPRSVITMLRKQKVEQLELHFKIPDRFVWHNLVFVNKNGGHLAATTLNRALKSFSEQMGLPEGETVNVHDFRDTYASRLYEKTKDLKMIQTLLGHADFNTTADVYTHVSAEEQKTFIDAVLN